VKNDDGPGPDIQVPRLRGEVPDDPRLRELRPLSRPLPLQELEAMSEAKESCEPDTPAEEEASPDGYALFLAPRRCKTCED